MQKNLKTLIAFFKTKILATKNITFCFAKCLCMTIYMSPQNNKRTIWLSRFGRTAGSAGNM